MGPRKILITLLGSWFWTVSVAEAGPLQCLRSLCGWFRHKETVASAPSSDTSVRVLAIKAALNDLSTDQDDIQKLFALFRDRRFLPQAGVVHVYGPGTNAYEWLLPLAARPDCKVYVHEIAWKLSTLGAFTGADFRVEGSIESLRYARTHTPEILKDISKHTPNFFSNSDIRSAEDLEHAMTDRMIVVEETSDQIEHGDLPPADVALMIGPFGYRVTPTAINSTGVVWLVREEGSDYGIERTGDFDQVAFEGELGRYLPNPLHIEDSGKFRTQSTGPGVLLVPKQR